MKIPTHSIPSGFFCLYSSYLLILILIHPSAELAEEFQQCFLSPNFSIPRRNCTDLANIAKNIQPSNSNSNHFLLESIRIQENYCEHLQFVDSNISLNENIDGIIRINQYMFVLRYNIVYLERNANSLMLWSSEPNKFSKIIPIELNSDSELLVFGLVDLSDHSKLVLVLFNSSDGRMNHENYIHINRPVNCLTALFCKSEIELYILDESQIQIYQLPISNIFPSELFSSQLFYRIHKITRRKICDIPQFSDLVDESECTWTCSSPYIMNENEDGCECGFPENSTPLDYITCDYRCNNGYLESEDGTTCECSTPKNAYLTDPSDCNSWKCESGFEKMADVCLLKGEDSDDSSSGMVLLLAILVPVILLLIGIGIYFLIKYRHLFLSNKVAPKKFDNINAQNPEGQDKENNNPLTTNFKFKIPVVNTDNQLPSLETQKSKNPQISLLDRYKDVPPFSSQSLTQFIQSHVREESKIPTNRTESELLELDETQRNKDNYESSQNGQNESGNERVNESEIIQLEETFNNNNFTLNSQIEEPADNRSPNNQNNPNQPKVINVANILKKFKQINN